MKFATKAAAAAMLMAMGLGISHAKAQKTTVGGWEITPDAGVTLTGISYDATSNTVTIDKKSATFSTNNGLGISFTQTGAGAASIALSTEAIVNATGTDWTSFEYAITGSALFDGVGNVFVPPIGTGVNYINVNLLPGHTDLVYTGSQSNGSTSNWGSSNPGDNLLIDANAPVDTLASFTLVEKPTGTSGGPSVVPLPTAAWQSLIGLLGLAALPIARRVKRLFA